MHSRGRWAGTDVTIITATIVASGASAHHIYEREGFVTTKRHWLYRTEVPDAAR